MCLVTGMVTTLLWSGLRLTELDVAEFTTRVLMVGSTTWSSATTPCLATWWAGPCTRSGTSAPTAQLATLVMLLTMGSALKTDLMDIKNNFLEIPKKADQNLKIIIISI